MIISVSAISNSLKITLCRLVEHLVFLIQRSSQRVKRTSGVCNLILRAASWYFRLYLRFTFDKAFSKLLITRFATGKKFCQVRTFARANFRFFFGGTWWREGARWGSPICKSSTSKQQLSTICSAVRMPCPPPGLTVDLRVLRQWLKSCISFPCSRHQMFWSVKPMRELELMQATPPRAQCRHGFTEYQLADVLATQAHVHGNVFLYRCLCVDPTDRY